MADTVRVVVAPGAHIALSPHPSGLAVLGPLVLHGGNTADVPPARAAALYAAGLILNPVTGELPPAPEAIANASVPTVSFDNGPALPVDGLLHIAPTWASTAEIRVPEPCLPPDPRSPRPAVTCYGSDNSTTTTVTDAFGQFWPQF